MPNSYDSNAIIRPEVLKLSAYHVPPASGMIKLDAMENPYALPITLRDEISCLVADAPVNRYPDAGAAALKATLRQALAIPDEMEVMLGNGSDEIIQIIALALAKPGAVLMSVEPAFAMFRMIATFTNIEYVGVQLKPDFSLDLDAILAAIDEHRPAVIFLAYPNNPSGNLFDTETVLRIIEATPGIVVIDEAYHAFADASLIGELTKYPNLLLMRTLSKLGLAGLRLGLLIGREEWLTHLEKLRLPYNVGVITQLVADAVLKHPDMLLAQAATIKSERSNMLKQLAGLPNVTVFPSDANFVLFRVNNADQVFATLKQHNVLIKNLNGAHTLLTNCLRVTVGTPEENQQFYQALQASIS